MQQLEAPEPHAGLRVHVDALALSGLQPLHPPHPAAEAVGLPVLIASSSSSSAHRKNGPHLWLCCITRSSALSSIGFIICEKEENLEMSFLVTPDLLDLQSVVKRRFKKT